jgi:hypothetical protein
MKTLDIISVEPIRIRKVRRRLLYKEIVQNPISHLRGQISYRINAFRYHRIAQDVPFWRIYLFFLRYFIWTFNIAMWLLKMAFIG